MSQKMAGAHGDRAKTYGNTVVYRKEACTGNTVVYRKKACTGNTVVYRKKACTGNTVVYRKKACTGKKRVPEILSMLDKSTQFTCNSLQRLSTDLNPPGEM